MKKKMIIIGLDGASFELLQPMIDDGTLPNLKIIQQKGCWADMEVCLPPVTCPNWKCYSTGKNPGKLGVFWWENIDIANKRVYHPRKRYQKHKEIWDYLSIAKKRCLIMNMPTTYPVKEINGYLIAGGPDAPEKGFTYPKNLEQQLEKEGYKVHAEKINPLIFSKEEIFADCRNVIKKRFEIFQKLIKEETFDFAQITLFYINAMQHFFWNDELTKDLWKLIDSNIGKLCKQHTVFLLSDHGSNPISTVFNINSWLEKEGYLVLKKNKFSSMLSALRINQESCYKFINKMGIKKEQLIKIIPESLLKLIPFEGGEIRKEAKTQKINWKKSRAIASGQGPVYLIDKSSALKKEIITKIKRLKNKKGENIAANVFTKEEIYLGPYLDIAPDIIIDQNKGVHIQGGIGKKAIFENPLKWKGENKKTGLFMAYGPEISTNGNFGKVHILDLAPTILNFFEINKPENMDGKVLNILKKEEVYEEKTYKKIKI